MPPESRPMTREELVRKLDALFREMPSDADLADWRGRIDTVDELVLALLNIRSVSANEIGRLKKERNIPVYVPKREEEVLNHVMSVNPGPLPDTAIRRLFERIIDETRSLERRNYQEEE
ncbi:MAG: chorismate mutase [Rhodothermales bacterium]